MYNSTFFGKTYKSIIALLIVVLVASCSLFGCDIVGSMYRLDTTEFDSEIIHGEELSLEGLVLKNRYPIGEPEVNVTPDMIIECDPTEGAGVKKLVIEYNGEQFTVEFEVKYKVDFVANEKVISSQLVSSSSELTAPEVVPEPGYEFVGWDVDFSSVELNDNLTINAVFKEIEYPEIADLTATYGDTLGDIVLPSNDYGHWEFIKEPTTSVGEAGRSRFGVRFVLADGSVVKNANVTITVKKQILEFTDILDSFIYDGKEHFPTYTLAEDLDVIVIGHPEINAGEYEFTLEINDKNYEGSYTGKYTIAKPDVTVVVSSATIKYGDDVPEFTFTVEGFEDIDLLGIEIDAPAYASSTGVFEITATVSNTNVNATVVNGSLTVEKVDFKPQPPVFGTCTYGDRVGDIELEPVAMGKWVWETPDQIVDNMSGVDAWVVFIPENSNHEQVRQQVRITDIAQKKLEINIVQSRFVYTEGVEYSIIYVIEDGSYTDIKVVGNDSASNAGTYLRTLEIVDERYFGSIALDLVIDKATPDVSFDLVLEGVWRPGMQLGDMTLPENFKWDAPGTVLANAGEAQYSARYDLENPNYNIPTGVITVKLDRAEGKISGAQQSYERMYDGTVYTIPGIMANHSESALIYEYLLNGEPVSAIKAAGVYDVTITLPETVNYTGASVTLTVTINKADNLDNVITIQNATYLDKLSSLILPTSTIGTWSWKDADENTTVGDVGTKTFVAVFTPVSGNYNAKEVEVTVNVAKKAISAVPTLNSSSLVYTGEMIAPEVIGADETLYTVTNLGGVNVGDYSVTLTLVDAHNYKWFDSDEATKTLGYSITKAQAIVSGLAIEGWTYGESAKAPTASTTFGSVRFVYSATYSGEYTETVPTLAGNYYVKAIVDGAYNYNGNESDPVSFVIAKAVVDTLPTISNTTLVYTGAVIYPTINGVDDSLYTVTNEGGVNVGNYNVTLTLKDSANYKWSDSDAATKTLGYSITKADAVISGLAIDGWTYGESAKAPAASTTFGTVRFVYSASEDGEYTAAVPTLAGTYYVKATVAGTSNFNGAESAPVSFVIAKAQAKITGLNPTYALTYTGDAFVVTGIGRSHGESELVYSVNGEVVSKISVVNAGTYTVVVTLPESANYLEAVAEATITVSPAENSIDYVNTNQNATYLDKIASLVLPVSNVGTWTWKDVNVNDTVGDVGTHTFVAVFTPETNNYLPKEVEVTVNVAKKAISVLPTLSANSFVYTGATLKPEVIGADETLYTVTNDGGIDVGNYVITLTLTDSANYKWSDSDEATKTLGYSITKAQAVISDLAINGWSYGESAKAPTASTTLGTVRFVYSATFGGEYTAAVPTLAGNYYVKAIVDGTDNYNGDESEPVGFTIAKAIVAVPALNSYALPYTGSVVKATLVNADETLYSIVNNGGTYAGDHCTVVLTLKDTANYKWADTDEADMTINYEIVKADPVISEFVINGWAYGESAKAPSASTTFGTATFTYSATEDGEYTATVPSAAGTYYVKATVEGAANWNQAEAVISFSIAKAQASITGLNATYETTYNGQAYVVTGVGRSHGESELAYTINGESAGSISVTNAGVYTVVVTLPESDNYLEATAEATITVLAAENTIDSVVTTQSATYLDKLSTLHLPTSTIGTWSWKGADENTTVGNAGTNKHIALFTPANGNYLAKEVEVTVNVAKLTVTAIPSLTQNSFEYTGSVIEPALNGVDSTLYTVTYPGSVNVGDYVITLTLTNPESSMWYDSESASRTISYSITKATASFSEFTVPTIEYGQSLAPKYTVNVGTVTVYYYDSEDCVTPIAAPTKIGQYWAKAVIAETANYGGATSASVSFSINKANPIVTFTPTTPSTDGAYYQNLLDFNKDTTAVDNKGNAVAGTISNIEVKFNESEYSFVFTPTDTDHYNPTTVTGTINLKTVATIGENGTAYGTIEDALREAKSGETVWVVADNTGNVYITEKEVTINSGVTLLIPFANGFEGAVRNKSGESTLQIDTGTRLYMTLAKEHPEYRQTLVKLAEGVTLTVSGTLEISGELTGGGGGNMAGHTAGMYAELMLQHNAKIVVGGAAKVYGYISNEDDSGEPGTLITVNNGGILYQPFTLVDFRGGSILKAVNDNIADKKNHPFCQFKFVNVSVETRYNYGSKMNVWANLDTSKLIGSGSQHNFKEVTFIGVGGVIELTDLTHSYMVTKYNPSTEIIKVNIYGGAKNNAMALTVSAGLTSVTVSSKDYFFGIAWYYDITFDNAPEQTTTAQFTMDFLYKLMPGSKLTVEEGATLNVNELTVYDVFNDPIYNTDNGAVTCPYPTVYPDPSTLVGQTIPPAKLIVKGGIVAGKLAGDVYAGADGATVVVNTATTITTNELEKHSGNSLSASAGSYAQITKNLKLIFDNELTEIELGETYMAIGGEWGIGIDYITIQIPNGVQYTAETTVNVENGIAISYAGSASGVGGENTFINIEKGTKVTLILGAGQVIPDLTNPNTLEFSLDEFYALAGSHSVEWYPVDNGPAPVKDVPIFNLTFTDLKTFSSSSVTITYEGLQTDNPYARVDISKTRTRSGYTCTVTVTVSGIDAGNITSSITPSGGAYTATSTVSLSIQVGKANSGADITITSDYSEKECITPDSLITLADGTQVRVDSLTGNEMLLVWNLETGKFDYAPIMFVDSESEKSYEVIYLYFSDGTLVKVISEHGFWDYDLNKYVYLDRYASEYIGHYFAKQNGDELTKVQLVDVELKTEMTSAWSPVTVGHLCYFVNGMLTMPGGIGGLFNIFEVDAETMTYDYEAIARDIETYGLFTYEELNAICPLTEEMFYAAGGQYLKISIGKGNLTMEELIYMIERYSIYV